MNFILPTPKAAQTSLLSRIINIGLKMSKSEKLWAKVLQKVRYVSLHEFDHNVHVSLRNNFMYVETPKVACSTLKLTLIRLELEDLDYSREDIHNRNLSPLLRASQVGDFQRLLRKENVLKFCFVRNPYERLLSCYLDKVRGKDRVIMSGLLRQLGRDQTNLSQDVGFDDLVAAIEATPISMMNAHWRPQFYQTFQEAIPYDVVGKLEQFDRHLNEIGRRLSKDFDRYYKSWNYHKTNSRRAVSEYYSADLRNRVYKLYEIDFDNFEYDKALPTN